VKGQALRRNPGTALNKVEGKDTDFPIRYPPSFKADAIVSLSRTSPNKDKPAFAAT
jgi:hypothetical protein